jgi:hypothetical protein
MPTTIARTKQINTPAGRRYQVESEQGESVYLPSVTTILSVVGKPALINWAANQAKAEVIDVAADFYIDLQFQPDLLSRPAFITGLEARLTGARRDQKILEKAGDIGSSIHKRIEWVLSAELGVPGREPEALEPEAQNAFNEWLQWRESVNFKPVLLEQQVYSLRHGYAGTMDVYAEVNGEMSVIDWKSGKAIYREAYLQNAAYAEALREMKHGEPESGYIVRLPKIAGQGFEVARLDKKDLRRNLDLFIGVIDLWKFVTAGRETT